MTTNAIPRVHAERFSGQVDEPTAFQLIRREQRVPGILSGPRATEEILSLDAVEVERAIRDDDHAILRLDLSGEIVWARASDFERDTLKQRLWHVEMTQLPADEPVVVDVTLEVHSKSALSRTRGAVLQHLESVRIEGPIELLPDVVHIDARLLRLDESIMLADLKLPRGCSRSVCRWKRL